MKTRWLNRRVQVTNGTCIVAVLLVLGGWFDETAFTGAALLLSIWNLVCALADAVDRRNELADRVERNTP